MNNSQIYPFERNRYYPGKMLTSADFEAEQSYFMNRERFLSGLMYGSGIVCGLGVFSLDDLSLLGLGSHLGRFRLTPYYPERQSSRTGSTDCYR